MPTSEVTADFLLQERFCSHYMDFALDTVAKIVFADQNNYQEQTDNVYKRTMSKIFDNNRILNYSACEYTQNKKRITFTRRDTAAVATATTSHINGA